MRDGPPACNVRTRDIALPQRTFYKTATRPVADHASARPAGFYYPSTTCAVIDHQLAATGQATRSLNPLNLTASVDRNCTAVGIAVLGSPSR
jgi:hypothetical protein